MRNLLKRRRLVFLWVFFVRKGGGILNDSSIHGQLTNYKGNRKGRAKTAVCVEADKWSLNTEDAQGHGEEKEQDKN